MRLRSSFDQEGEGCVESGTSAGMPVPDCSSCGVTWYAVAPSAAPAAGLSACSTSHAGHLTGRPLAVDGDAALIVPREGRRQQGHLSRDTWDGYPVRSGRRTAKIDLAQQKRWKR